MTQPANVQLILDLYDAFARGDLAAVLNFLDANAELHFEGPQAIPWARTFHGREGWIRFFQILAENLDGITLDMHPFAAQDDNVVTAGRYQALVKRTGKRIDSPLVHLWTIRNGLVAKCLEMTDTASEAAACTPDA
jgi:uncharacterized protein